MPATIDHSASLIHEQVFLLQALTRSNFAQFSEADQIAIIDRAATLVCNKDFQGARQIINMLQGLVCNSEGICQERSIGLISDYLESWHVPLSSFTGDFNYDHH